MNRPTEAIEHLSSTRIPGVSAVTSYVRWLEAEYGQLRDHRNEALASFRSAQRSLGAIDQELGLGMDATLAETLAEIKRVASERSDALKDVGAAILKLDAIRLALKMPAGTGWREWKVVKEVLDLVEAHEAVLPVLREVVNSHECTYVSWQVAHDLLAKAEGATR